MAKLKIELVCEGASKSFDIDHAERLLEFQKTNKGVTKKTPLWSIPTDSKFKLQDGKLIKIASASINKKSKEQS